MQTQNLLSHTLEALSDPTVPGMTWPSACPPEHPPTPERPPGSCSSGREQGSDVAWQRGSRGAPLPPGLPTHSSLASGLSTLLRGCFPAPSLAENFWHKLSFPSKAFSTARGLGIFCVAFALLGISHINHWKAGNLEEQVRSSVPCLPLGTNSCGPQSCSSCRYYSSPDTWT